MKTGHVGLNVSNLESSLAFYTEIFGFEILRESFEKGKKFAFLGHNGEVTVTLWEQCETSFSKSHAGLHHLAFEVDSLETVQRMEEKLKQMGVTLIYPGITAHEEGAQSGGLFFLDPDGIRLEIYSPVDIASHEAHAKEGPACGFF